MPVTANVVGFHAVFVWMVKWIFTDYVVACARAFRHEFDYKCETQEKYD